MKDRYKRYVIYSTRDDKFLSTGDSFITWKFVPLRKIKDCSVIKQCWVDAILCLKNGDGDGYSRAYRSKDFPEFGNKAWSIAELSYLNDIIFVPVKEKYKSIRFSFSKYNKVNVHITWVPDFVNAVIL